MICREKPNQHATCLSRSVRVWSQNIRSLRGQCIVTFHGAINRFVRIHCPREEGLSTQFLSHNSQWGSGERTSFDWQPSTRLIGPITPACDRYIQYLLTGPNPSVLNRQAGGYNLEGVDFLHTTPWPFQLMVSLFHLWAPPGLQFIHKPPTKPAFEFKDL
jgi:hypothetical protein